ncbi:hypothetical protein BJ166DRAFT_532842 [Pestalotiopsis sp. NC0098]|nr:hypothetical protein BJ166DRAFT_532842 [Pestalotiopsis sp. NC0098]
MRSLLLLLAGLLTADVSSAAPTAHDLAAFHTTGVHDIVKYKRENLCNLKTPPALCQPNASVTVEETALRAYQFYRAFVVDGDPRTMFSLIDSTYKQHHPGYADGPNNIWPLFCGGSKIGTEQNTTWCFDASTNMSYAKYSTTDRWLWLDGCVHEHWDQGETIPTDKCYKLNSTNVY